jgi:hypothetical protein
MLDIDKMIGMIVTLLRFGRSHPGFVRSTGRGMGVIVVLMLAGCSTTSTHAIATNTPIPAPTPIPGVPELPVTLTSCSDLPNGASLTIPGFNFNGKATVTVITPAQTPMEVDAYIGCIADPTQMQALQPWQRVAQTLNVDKGGWQVATSFPFDGAQLQQCGSDQHCYSTTPQNFLLIDRVSALPAHLLVFLLLKAEPQPLVLCDPGLFPNTFYTSDINSVSPGDIPLPPLTRISTEFGINETSAQRYYLCSAGTAQSVADFMQKQLPAKGWVATQVNGRAAWKTVKSPTYYLFIPTITDPLKWYLDFYSLI